MLIDDAEYWKWYWWNNGKTRINPKCSADEIKRLWRRFLQKFYYCTRTEVAEPFNGAGHQPDPNLRGQRSKESRTKEMKTSLRLEEAKGRPRNAWQETGRINDPPRYYSLNTINTSCAAVTFGLLHYPLLVLVVLHTVSSPSIRPPLF